MRRIVVVGDLVTDVVAVLGAGLARGTDTPARIRFTGGGQAANTAAWLAWAGVPVTLTAAVGADDAGAARLAELVAAGVDTAVTRRPDAATGSIVVLVDGAERTMVTDRGASLLLTAADVDDALTGAAGAAHVHVSGYLLLDRESREAGRRALAAAHERGLTTSIDAASAAPLRRVGDAFLDWVRGTDLLLANRAEAAVLTGVDEPRAQAAALATVAGVAAIVKCGEAGAVWADVDGTLAATAAPAATLVDPTGAGDAFAAGLLAAFVGGAEPMAALREGIRFGGLAVGHVGARPPLPT